MEDILYISSGIKNGLLAYCSEDLVDFVLNHFRQNHPIVEREERPPVATWTIDNYITERSINDRRRILSVILSFTATGGIVKLRNTSYQGDVVLLNALYYFNEASECLFKIPHGFKFAKGSDWDVDGVHFFNADSTIVINLTCLDRGFAKAKGKNVDNVTEEDILSQVACDNADIRMYYEVSDNGYLKVGFTPDFKPMLEKCIAHFDNDEDMINEHLHIVRLVYPDTLASQAFNINFDYIEPWPTNFYK